MGRSWYHPAWRPRQIRRYGGRCGHPQSDHIPIRFEVRYQAHRLMVYSQYGAAFWYIASVTSMRFDVQSFRNQQSRFARAAPSDTLHNSAQDGIIAAYSLGQVAPQDRRADTVP